MEGELKIGELASAAGVNRNIIIIYEQRNLLPCAGRTRGGYRLYREEDIERLRFIRQAQALGFSIDEIRELLPEPGAGLAECRRVRDRLRSRLEEMDAQLAEVRSFRRTLVAYLEECEAALTGKRGDTCPVLFEITHKSRRRARQRIQLTLRGKAVSEGQKGEKE
jgi:DNA-binding transcriptional MerR regulator